MIKKLLSLIILVVVVGAGVFFVAGNVVLAKALEAAIGAPVKVGKLHVSLSPFELGMKDFEIKNPPGFQEPFLASVPEIFIRMELASLFRNRIHVEEVRLNLDQITVERTAQGAVNLMELGAIKGARERPVGERPAPAPSERPQEEPSAKPAQGPALQIDRVLLSLGRAHYADYGLGGPLVREFPLEIENALLTNVTDPRQITQQIVFKTLQKVGLNALLPNLQQLGVGWEAQSASMAESFKEGLSSLREKFKF